VNYDANRIKSPKRGGKKGQSCYCLSGLILYVAPQQFNGKKVTTSQGMIRRKKEKKTVRLNRGEIACGVEKN
jgi:hypothetical protein